MLASCLVLPLALLAEQLMCVANTYVGLPQTINTISNKSYLRLPHTINTTNNKGQLVTLPQRTVN